MRTPVAAWPPVRRASAERGSAVVEFVALAVLLLVPTIYFVATLAQVQAATFAVEAGAREAGRILATAESDAEARARAEAAVALAGTDQRLEVPAALETACDARPCLTPGAGIVVRVSTTVPLPLLPDAVVTALGAGIDVHAEHEVRVDRFVDVRP